MPPEVRLAMTAQFLAFAALSLITFGLVRFIVKFGADVPNQE